MNRIAICLFAAAITAAAAPKVVGPLKVWQPLTISFDGPPATEDATPNLAGHWRYAASFRRGTDVAVSMEPDAGAPVAPDGVSGSFSIGAADSNAPGYHAKGLLPYAGGHYLRHAGNGEYFLKGGADSPENFLAYYGFDDTFDTDATFAGGRESTGKPFIHRYEPHAKDWSAGGSGVEWYFGYKFPHSDVSLEEFRSRDAMWDETRHAIEFFRRHLPFQEMSPNDSLSEGNWVLAKPGEVYAVYAPNGGAPKLKLESGSYRVQWFNPRGGGPLKAGSTATVAGPGEKSLGTPPSDRDSDWAVLVTSTR
ncbi:MAG: hypothetical protein FJW20_14090 [Acidimicrobiia bacterium]|nr:hypothetical protein [Acidimicrobiia bacterium]